MNKIFFIGAISLLLCITTAYAQSSDCFTPHEQTGCSNTDCTACVCGMDTFCCEYEWDSVCVDEAQTTCAAACGWATTTTTTTTTTTIPTDCCSTHEEAGCGISSCQECVCNYQATCCSGTWSSECVTLAATTCFNECGCTATTTTSSTTTTIVSAPEMATPLAGLLALLLAPTVAYLLIRKK